MQKAYFTLTSKSNPLLALPQYCTELGSMKQTDEAHKMAARLNMTLLFCPCKLDRIPGSSQKIYYSRYYNVSCNGLLLHHPLKL